MSKIINTETEPLDKEKGLRNEKDIQEDGQVTDITQNTKKTKWEWTLRCGLILLITGLALLNFNEGGSAAKDFLSGLILGIGCTVSLIGVYITIRTLAANKQ